LIRGGKESSKTVGRNSSSHVGTDMGSSLTSEETHTSNDGSARWCHLTHAHRLSECSGCTQLRQRPLVRSTLESSPSQEARRTGSRGGDGGRRRRRRRRLGNWQWSRIGNIHAITTTATTNATAWSLQFEISIYLSALRLGEMTVQVHDERRV
jgi:hypothetical protein